MAIAARIEPIADWLQVSTVETLSPPARGRAVAAFARERLLAAQDANRAALGRLPGHRTFVDGRPEAPLESVRPEGGRIVFEFDLVADLLMWIWQTLRERSPIVSGAYRDGHRLYADGREIALSPPVPPAAEYAFVNTVPYARKIEVGTTRSGRAFTVQVPNRIYERTAADARRRFGNIATVGFSYRSPFLAYGGPASGRGGRERTTRAPAILVSVR